jgi:hypothetical protein
MQNAWRNVFLFTHSTTVRVIFESDTNPVLITQSRKMQGEKFLSFESSQVQKQQQQHQTIASFTLNFLQYKTLKLANERELQSFIIIAVLLQCRKSFFPSSHSARLDLCAPQNFPKTNYFIITSWCELLLSLVCKVPSINLYLMLSDNTSCMCVWFSAISMSCCYKDSILN